MKWEDRGQYEHRNLPGVYVIAITEKDLEGKKVNYRDISYIGMSVHRLSSRWRGFDRAIRGKGGHSGGRAVYDDLKNYKDWKKKLFVSASPREVTSTKKGQRTRQDLLTMGVVAFLEYKALARYRKVTGDEPKYNTQ